MAQGTTDDELVTMCQECALVMLSACQTGVAYVSSGDQLLGLSRRVFRAGASSLVASLRKVNDESTVDLTVEFYRSLMARRTKPQAPGCAALRVRNRLPHPYYWAPFVLLGDPRAGVTPVRTPGASSRAHCMTIAALS